jgi:hypothetical protein
MKIAPEEDVEALSLTSGCMASFQVRFRAAPPGGVMTRQRVPSTAGSGRFIARI